MADTEATSLVRQLREALHQIDVALDPDDWAGEQRMLDITRPAIAAADEWLAQQRGPLTDEEISRMWMAGYSDGSGDSMVSLFARAIERAHGIGLPTVEDKPC
jgi:hypothetical protein